MLERVRATGDLLPDERDKLWGARALWRDARTARIRGSVKEGFEMSEVVFEHVPVADLPAAWRAKLDKSGDTLVTVRIEEEVQAALAEGFTTDDPAFGIWRDREDMADVAAHVRNIRQPRYNHDGSRHEP